MDKEREKAIVGLVGIVWGVLLLILVKGLAHGGH